MASEDLAKQTAQQVGTLVATILSNVFGDRSSMIEQQLGNLRKGDFSRQNVKSLIELLREHDPHRNILEATRRTLTPTAFAKVRSHVEAASYGPLLDYLCQQLRPEDLKSDVNLYADATSTVARRLIGAAIMHLTGPGNVQTGIITSVGVYDGTKDTHTKHFPGQIWIPGAEPGTIGTWHGSGRSNVGYDVATLAAHSSEQPGYVAILKTSRATGKGIEQLGMHETAVTFGFDALRGKSIIDPQSPLKIALREHPETRKLTDLVEVQSMTPTEASKLGALAGYNLGQY